jgi:DNA replication protein DnaC
MDDVEMGRPVRHERPAKRSELAAFSPADVGGGAIAQVIGEAACECGAGVAVNVSGPENSMLLRIARSRLASPRCDECLERDERERQAEEAQRGAMELILRRLERSGLPNVWRTLSFEELRVHPARVHQDEAIERARAWARSPADGLLLHGDVGRGKTLIAAAATVARCAASDVRWLAVAELLMDLRMPFTAPEYARAQRQLDPGRGVALVLDDLDKLRPTEHQLQPLYVAINAWIEARQPLLVTCNRGLDELAAWMGETFGPPISSRLAGYCDVVEIQGSDWRLS